MLHHHRDANHFPRPEESLDDLDWQEADPSHVRASPDAADTEQRRGAIAEKEDFCRWPGFCQAAARGGQPTYLG